MAKNIIFYVKIMEFYERRVIWLRSLFFIILNLFIDSYCYYRYQYYE